MWIQRDIIEQFKIWKNRADRKPILLKGARQIGKTRAMEQFGKECFKYVAKFDFDRQPELKEIFKISKQPSRILRELALYSDSPLDPENTLIIFDEIQECEEALNSLKYFYEDAPEYHIIAAGSLLGVAVRKRSMTVPVGKVNIMRMFPLTFKEFLRASDLQVYEYIEQLSSLDRLPEIILNKLNTEYRRYTVCGGMPEPMVALLDNQGIAAVDEKLQDILDLYELDFAKYATTREIPRIHGIWHSLPSQLGKENRKFVYNIIRSGARSKDYEDALMWLEDTGMIYSVYHVSKPAIPLSAYQQRDIFKVYACDCGLLRQLAHLPASAILDPVSSYTEFKGAIAENVVLQCLIPTISPQAPSYWTSAGIAELEYLLQISSDIIPVEVKAEGNIGGKSLAQYTKKYSPRYRIRFSSLNLQYNGGLLSAPSALASWLPRLYTLLTTASPLVSD